MLRKLSYLEIHRLCQKAFPHQLQRLSNKRDRSFSQSQDLLSMAGDGVRSTATPNRDKRIKPTACSTDFFRGRTAKIFSAPQKDEKTAAWTSRNKLRASSPVCIISSSPAGDLKSVQPWSFPSRPLSLHQLGGKDQQHHCKSSLHHPVHFQIRAHLL